MRVSLLNVFSGSFSQNATQPCSFSKPDQCELWMQRTIICGAFASVAVFLCCIGFLYSQYTKRCKAAPAEKDGYVDLRAPSVNIAMVNVN